MQKNWLYLEPIFQSEDIMRQLPSEAKRFATVNRIWKSLLSAAHENPFCYPYMTQTENCLEQFTEVLHMFPCAHVRLCRIWSGGSWA